MDEFEIEMLNRIDSGIKLTEREMLNLAYEYEVERKEGEDDRWSRSIISYIQLGDRYFCIEWNEGLTEMQPNECYKQPYEVIKNTHTEIIPEHKVIVTEWNKK